MNSTPYDSNPAGPLRAMRSQTRRRFLQTAVGGAAALGGAAFLQACGAGSGGSSTGGGKPQRGGRLTVAMITGGQAESYNPAAPIGNIFLARIQTLFDPLVTLSPDLRSAVPMLAKEWEANEDFTVWTFQLREGVTFTDGKPFTADDVLYTMRQWSSPEHFSYTPMGETIDYRKLRKRGKLTVEVPLKVPMARLPQFLCLSNCYIVQNGATDFTKPVGTGPFELASFTPGRQSLQRRNPNYWMENRPYLDELEIISFADSSAQINALLGGQANLTAGLTYTQAKAQESSSQVTLLRTSQPGPIPFTMRIDQAPFNDARVRQAMRLIADREALVEGAFNGFGTVGNDIVGPGLEFFDDSLPQREQDLEQAKSLLKSAGQEGMSVTLQTSPVIAGFVEAATLYAEQASGAGINVEVKQEPPSAYYDPSQLYLKMLFAQDSLIPFPGLDNVYTLNLTSSGPYNETGWGDAQWDKQVSEARGSVGQKADRIYQGLQEKFYEEGSYVIWGQPDLLDAHAPQVQGLRPHKLGNAGNYEFASVWLDQ